MKKTLLIDLDGVLNNYKGKYNEFEIPEPKAGVEEFLANLVKTYKIEIFTVRNKELTQKWLNKYNLNRYINKITNLKSSYASIIIDDRALQFNGDYKETLEKIKNFKPYWKNL